MQPLYGLVAGLWTVLLSFVLALVVVNIVVIIIVITEKHIIISLVYLYSFSIRYNHLSMFVLFSVGNNYNT